MDEGGVDPIVENEIMGGYVAQDQRDTHLWVVRSKGNQKGLRFEVGTTLQA